MTASASGRMQRQREMGQVAQEYESGKRQSMTPKSMQTLKLDRVYVNDEELK